MQKEACTHLIIFLATEQLLNAFLLSSMLMTI